MDFEAVRSTFSTWLNMLQLCVLEQVTCPFWASPFTITVMVFYSVTPQALQLCWLLWVPCKSEASLLLSKAREQY